MSTAQERYDACYHQIARDHVAYARENGGGNPFMEPALVETLELATETLVRRYVTEGSLILDAGCGPGTLLARLDGYERVGVDLSREYIDYAATLPGNQDTVFHEWRLENLYFFPHAGHYHAVLCTDVLEHVLDEHAVLRELTRVLKPGGHLIIRVPYEEDLTPYLGHSSNGYEYVHLRRFDHATLMLLLEKAHGLVVVDQSTVTYPGWYELHTIAVKP